MAEEKFVFAPARREEIRAKVCLTGSSGSGKTLSALLLAHGLAGDWRRIAVVDTENDSAKQYCGQQIGDTIIPQDEGSFFHCSLGPPYSCERIVSLIRQVEESGNFDVLIFDTFSHAWTGSGGVLERVDAIGKLEGWKQMTPRFRRMIDAMRMSSLHVIATLRTKTEFEIESTVNEQGKSKILGVKKIGTKPEMRDGVDYEFTCVFGLDADHLGKVDKDRTNLFRDRPPSLLNVATGKMLREWCGGAVCQIGSADWVALRIAELNAYNGDLPGLATMWSGVSGHRSRCSKAAWEALTAAKDAGKARLTAAK